MPANVYTTKNVVGNREDLIEPDFSDLANRYPVCLAH